MSFYVCGDTHGDIDIHKLTTKAFPDGKKLTKKDYLLVCGDFGCVWDGDSHDRNIRKFYNQKPWTTLFVEGNHENHVLLNKFPVEKWNGGKIHRISDSIIHLMRGQVFNIDGKKIFTMGGADSPDKGSRKLGISWWREELPTRDEISEAIKNINKHKSQVDYIFTHCASSRVQKHFGETNELTDFFTGLENIDFQHWYFGHYHEDKGFGEKFTCLYQTVVKLW